ncbi:MAG: two-component system, OmpR family, sensor histidine kinase KdpD [Chloroflexota bacterium]|jgi:two-component system sensor histidine kinase KdpD|nr:two-component system, OmpR family, sensor histidine kinase KdpD [Chloroflexota bacterium]
MRRDSVLPYLFTVLAVAVTFGVVGILKSTVVDLPAAILLYLVPIVLAASRWGRGPAVVGVAVAILGHDLLFVDPRGTFSVARADEALGLVLLLFTALVTAQLADGARRSAETAREAAIVRRSEELKTALLHAVTHTLRTPLASIKASVSGLRQPGATYDDADRAELLAEIEEEADRLDRVVTNLLDASRLEAGGIELHRDPQELGELVGAVVDRLQPMLAGRCVQVDVPEGLPPVSGDYAQLDHVVTNLLENAARHTPAGTPVLVRARADGTMIRTEVVDRGAGVPVAERERLFRPFERGQTGATGTGLGLTIARGFVEAHGGALWLEDGPEGGARFTFTLPVWSKGQ